MRAVRAAGCCLRVGVGQEEAWERWTPILEHADQRSTLEVFGDAILRDPSKSRPVESRLNYQVEFIEEQ